MEESLLMLENRHLESQRSKEEKTRVLSSYHWRKKDAGGGRSKLPDTACFLTK